MKHLMNKLTTTLAGVALFCVGSVIAGLGLSVVIILAMFALAVSGLALVSAPLIGWAQPSRHEATHQEPNAMASTTVQ